jgi:hypothetical protein
MVGDVKFSYLNGITGTGPTVVVGNGNVSVEGLSTESNGQPISSFGAIFQTLNTNYTANTVYTLTLNITFNVPLSANPLTVDNIGIALTAGGSQTSPGSTIASSLAPNASTVITATPGFLAKMSLSNIQMETLSPQESLASSSSRAQMDF